LGKLLAHQHTELVYGGGNVGLMGEVASSILAHGGKAIGVITKLLETRELAHRGVQRLEVVETMHERKMLMATLADGFIALPGGLGTLDELLEVMAWRQLGCIDKPIALLNTAGYFDPWLGVLRQAVKEGFLDQAEVSRLMVHDRVDRLLEALEENLPLVAAP
jgi:uncharacterized protein (TIGR00730 family)